MEDCLFCKIVRGEIPAEIIKEIKNNWWVWGGKGGSCQKDHV